MEERWASIGGHRMRYLRGGSGPALVLIHGLLGYSFSWRFNLAALGEHATVYAPDLLGFGYSERYPKMDCSLRGTAERMWQFMDGVRIEEADILGTSHGGAVTMTMAAMQPQRVRRLMLVAPVNPWSRYGRLLTRVLATRIGGLGFRVVQPYLSQKYFLRRLYGDVRRIAPGTVEGYSAPLLIPGTIAHALAIARCWHADLRQLESALPSIAHIPTLLMWGSRDRAVLPSSARTLAAHFKRAELVMLDGVGHLPYEEVPEEFNRIVIKYLGQEADHPMPQSPGPIS